MLKKLFYFLFKFIIYIDVKCVNLIILGEITTHVYHGYSVISELPGQKGHTM